MCIKTKAGSASYLTRYRERIAYRNFKKDSICSTQLKGVVVGRFLVQRKESFGVRVKAKGSQPIFFGKECIKDVVFFFPALQA